MNKDTSTTIVPPINEKNIQDNRISRLRLQFLLPLVFCMVLILVVVLLISKDSTFVASSLEPVSFLPVTGTILLVAAFLLSYFYINLGRIAKQLTHTEYALQSGSVYDGVTGLYNHRSFYTLLERELNRRERYKQSLSLLIIDIDQFTQLNSTYGFAIGSAVLNELGSLLKEEARNTDFVCRYGGEKITIILPQTPGEGALIIAERLRNLIEVKGFAPESNLISITVSLGVATSPEHGSTVFEIISAANTALGAAKASGRNRVCVYKDENKPESILD